MIGTFNKILKRILGDKRETDLKLVQPIVTRINEIGATLTNISHDELRNRATALKKRIADHTASMESEIVRLKSEAESLPSTELEQKEAIFNQVDALTKDIDQEIEKVLEEILPEAFAIVKETARRLKEYSRIEVRAMVV